jgi:hypothetical protein
MNMMGGGVKAYKLYDKAKKGHQNLARLSL